MSTTKLSLTAPEATVRDAAAPKDWGRDVATPEATVRDAAAPKVAENPLTARAAILGALISGKSYGLEIIKKVAERTKGAIVLTEGSIYPTLKLMEKEGLLETFPGEPIPERGGRPRIYYALTGVGLRVAREQRAVLRLFVGVPAEVP